MRWQEFWKRHPQISVDVHVAGSQRACDAVAEGECDLALAFDVRVPRNVRKIATAALPLGVVLILTTALPAARK